MFPDIVSPLLIPWCRNGWCTYRVFVTTHFSCPISSDICPTMMKIVDSSGLMYTKSTSSYKPFWVEIFRFLTVCCLNLLIGYTLSVSRLYLTHGKGKGIQFHFTTTIRSRTNPEPKWSTSNDLHYISFYSGKCPVTTITRYLVLKNN